MCELKFRGALLTGFSKPIFIAIFYIRSQNLYQNLILFKIVQTAIFEEMMNLRLKDARLIILKRHRIHIFTYRYCTSRLTSSPVH